MSTVVPGVGPAPLGLLVVVALAGGIGVATVGPGGVFVTIALFVVTTASSGTVAGTTSALVFLGGLLGTVAYWRSGELAELTGRRLAVVLAVTGAAGAFAGSQLNAVLSAASFGSLLAAVVLLAGASLWWRERGEFEPLLDLDPASARGRLAVAGIGVGVGLPSGTLGVGGPVLAVPLLVLVGVPLLTAVASAQLLSVFVAGAATGGYLARGTVDVALLAALSPPFLLGIVIGWRVAHRVDSGSLRRVLAVVLIAVGAYLLGSPTHG